MQFPYAVPSGLKLELTQGLWRANADDSTFDALSAMPDAPRGIIVVQAPSPVGFPFVVLPATHGTPALEDAIGVALHATRSGKHGKYRFVGVVTVRLVPGLVGPAPDNGDPIYVSSTPGLGTITPGGKRLGVIMDVARYGIDGTVVVLLNCCEPPRPQ